MLHINNNNGGGGGGGQGDDDRGRDRDRGGVEQYLPSLRQPLMINEPPKGVRESGLSPFLLRTYEIVDDPTTNSIVSWSRFGTSFIIKNHLKMASEILPRFFRHSNFASFVYQLNNYGFRKIGLEQWEYENVWFQAGKKYLLVNIKRRNQIQRITQRRRGRKQEKIDPKHCDLDAELDNLSNGLKSSKIEIQKLKQRQEDVKNQIDFFKEETETAENKSRRMILFFAKGLGRPFLEDVFQLIGEEIKDCGSIEKGKKRKFLELESMGNAADDSEMPDDSTGPDQERDNATPAEIVSKNSGESAFWKKFLEENSCETEAESELTRQQSKIDMELDDMIACKIAAEVYGKPTDLVAEEEINLQLWA